MKRRYVIVLPVHRSTPIFLIDYEEDARKIITEQEAKDLIFEAVLANDVLQTEAPADRDRTVVLRTISIVKREEVERVKRDYEMTFNKRPTPSETK